MAFECPHCGFKNNEIQSGQAMNEKGCTFNCQIKTTKVTFFFFFPSFLQF